MNADLQKLLRTFAVFSAPLVVLFALLELGLGRVQNSYSKKRDGLAREQGRIEVLVTGSSHGLDGIDPARFGRPAYNIGNVSQSLINDVDLCFAAMPRLPRLAAIVMPISYFSLDYKLGENAEAWRNHFYVRFFGIATDGPFYTRVDPSSYSLYLMYGPEQARSMVAARFAMDLAPGVTNLGWERVPGLGAGTLDAAHGRARAAFHEGLMRPENRADNLHALERLLDAARSRGVRVAFVTTPVYWTYRQAIDRARWGEHQRVILELAGRYGAPYSDFLDDGRFDRADFYNDDHLNEDGAAKFTKILDAEVLASMR